MECAKVMTDADAALMLSRMKTISLAIVPFAVIGILTNIILVVVIFKTRMLQSRCNILVAFLSMSETGNCFYYLQNGISFLYQENATGSRCYLQVFYAHYAVSLQCSLNLALGMDRLIMLTVSDWYQNWNNKLYLCCVLCSAFLLGSITPVTQYIVTRTDSNVTECRIKLDTGANHNYSISIYEDMVFYRTFLIYMSAILVATIVTFLSAQIAVRLLRSRSAAAATATVLQLNTLSLLTFPYVFFWLFYFIETIVSWQVDLSCTAVTILSASTYFNLMDFGGNFFIFLWRVPPFRKSVIRLFAICCRKNGNPESDDIVLLSIKQVPQADKTNGLVDGS